MCKPNTFLALATDEIIRLARFFVGAGIRKIRLTGGEPLVNPDIEHICEEIGKIPDLEALAITTNGLVLERKLPALKAAGLNQINISLDTLIPGKFEFITRRKGFDRVIGAIDAAIAEGYRHSTPHSVKVNVCVMNGFNDDELVNFGADNLQCNHIVSLLDHGYFDSPARCEVSWTENKPIDV